MTKTKKPSFVVKESNFSASVKSRWRKPRGKHSPVRQYHKGRPARPHPGYGAALAQKGLHTSGKLPVIVATVADVKRVNKESEAALLSGNVGTRKAIAILTRAKEQGVAVLNVKDIDQKIALIQEVVKARQEKAKQRKLKKVSSPKKEDKKSAKKDAPKKAEEKKAPEKKAGEEQK